jgi:ABC-type Mn2+/Zn2+ transport system ATPase subunit
LNEQQHASPTTNHNSTIAEVTRPRFEMPLSVEEMMRLSKEKKNNNTKKSKEKEESKWIKFLMKLK